MWVVNPKAQMRENSMGGQLQPHYQGPCRLIKRLSPNTFTVHRLDDNVNLDVTNAERFKPYIELSRNNRSTKTIVNGQSFNRKKAQTSIENDMPPTHNLERWKMKKNKSPKCNELLQS